jgi:hypothetical protein
MPAQSGYVHFHEGIERKRIQDFVEFGRAFDLENTDVRELAGHAPEVRPLSLFLQYFGALMLQDAKLFDLLWIRAMWDADTYVYVEEHLYPLSEIAVHASDTGL